MSGLLGMQTLSGGLGNYSASVGSWSVAQYGDTGCLDLSASNAFSGDFFISAQCSTSSRGLQWTVTIEAGEFNVFEADGGSGALTNTITCTGADNTNFFGGGTVTIG